MIAPDETFDGTWPFEPRFFDGHGFRQQTAIGLRKTGNLRRFEADAVVEKKATQ